MCGPRHADYLRGNNEIAGFKFATFGVIFAVLLAFAIILIWERFNQADTDVANEAGATALRLTRGLDAEHGGEISKATTAESCRILSPHPRRRRARP